MVMMASYVNKFNSHIDNHDDSLEQYKSTSLKGGLIMSVVSVPSLYKCKFYYWELNYINTSMDVTHFDLSLIRIWVMKLNTLQLKFVETKVWLSHQSKSNYLIISNII